MKASEEKKDFTQMEFDGVRKAALGRSRGADRHALQFELVRRITLPDDCPQRREAREFLLTEFEEHALKPILYKYGILPEEFRGEFYEFISASYKDVPYGRLLEYNGRNNASLMAFVQMISRNYFLERLVKERERLLKRVDFDENFGAMASSADLESDDFPLSGEVSEGPGGFAQSCQENPSSEEDQREALRQVKAAMEALNPKDRLVLHLSCVGGLHGDEIYDRLLDERLIEPSEEPLSDKQKQKKVSQWKKSALKRCKEIYQGMKS